MEKDRDRIGSPHSQSNSHYCRPNTLQVSPQKHILHTYLASASCLLHDDECLGAPPTVTFESLSILDDGARRPSETSRSIIV